MNNSPCDEKVPEENEKQVSGKTARKIFLLVSSAVIFVFLVVVILAGLVSAELLSSKPLECTPEVIDLKAAASVQKKIMPVYQEMFRCKPDEPYKLTFSGKEINVVLLNVQMMGKTIAANQQSNDEESPRLVWPEGLNIKYDNKSFCCAYSCDLRFSTPFGKYINLYGKVIPEMKDGNIKLVCKDIKAGELDVPSGLVNQKIAEGLSQNRENITELTKIISDFYIDDKGLLHVTLYPYALRVYIMEYMKQRMQRKAEEQKLNSSESKKAASRK